MKIKLSSHLFLIAMLLLSIAACKKDAVTITPVTPPVAAKGKSYYVSDGTGADANTGLSSNAAFKTINAGITAAAAGDTVFLLNGTYTAAINIIKSGSANAYITIKNYPAQSPKIYISGNIWNAFTINGCDGNIYSSGVFTFTANLVVLRAGVMGEEE